MALAITADAAEIVPPRVGEKDIGAEVHLLRGSLQAARDQSNVSEAFLACFFMIPPHLPDLFLGVELLRTAMLGYCRAVGGNSWQNRHIGS